MRTLVLMRTVVLVGVLAVMAPATARAGSISLDTRFQGQGLAIVLNNDPYSLFSVGSVSASAAIDLGSLDSLTTFELYCVDFFTDAFFPDPGLPLPPDTYNAEAGLMSDWSAANALNTDTARQRAAWLYNEYASSFADVSTELGESQRSALQIAIWNVLYDGDLSVAAIGGGTTYITGDTTGVTALAQTYLGALALSTTVATADATWLQLTYTNPAGGTIDAQDMIGPASASSTPVPEPSAGLLLGMGAMSLAAFRSRKTLFRRS
jgi:hypothetical protein